MDKSEQLKKGVSEMEEILRTLKIIPVKILGRVKTQESAKAKLEKTVMSNKIHFSDSIGMRVIFQTEEELDIVFKKLITANNILFIKDYVNNPRKDGLIMNSDPNDIYQSYHVFTDSFNGVLIEIQLRTQAMETNRLRLAEKYGDEYWKTNAFRENKYKLGDVR